MFHHVAMKFHRDAMKFNRVAIKLHRVAADARFVAKCTERALPQTGHDTAQLCPSKHPDGYRETVLRRP